MDGKIAEECGLRFISTLFYARMAYVGEYEVLDAKKFAYGLLKHGDAIEIYGEQIYDKHKHA